MNIAQLNTAIGCIRTAREKVDHLQTKLKRETVVMEEKIKVSDESYHNEYIAINPSKTCHASDARLPSKKT